MESVLKAIAEAPPGSAEKKRAYELIVKIIENIVNAANNGDPDGTKYRWIKAHSGSALREKVLDVDPLFQSLLKELGFRFTVGRPPHVRTGPPQEYAVLPDDASLENFASIAQLLKAIAQSLPDYSLPSGESGNVTDSSPSVVNVPEGQRHVVDTSLLNAGLIGSSLSARPPASPSARRSGHNANAELELLRREQQARYRQRETAGGSTSRPSTERSDEASAAGNDASRDGGWFWQKLGWGGNNNNDNDDSSSQGRSTSSRRPPLSNRMMTLRDLPKPQRRG